MKIGILTRRFGYNVGSSLQALAMAEMCKMFAEDVEIIDYDEVSFHPMWGIRPKVEHLLFYSFIPPFGKKRKYLSQRMKQEKKFKEFERKYMPLSSQKYNTQLKLQNLSKTYDKIVVGSDQIWSPFLIDLNFLGNFLKDFEKNKFVPYAPSIGTSNINNIKEIQIQLLRSLPDLSCREKKGAEILHQITNKEVPVVIDPTLMVNPKLWEKIANDHKIENLPQNYILTYFLGKTCPNEVISKKAKETSALIINIAMFNRRNDIIPDINLKDIGPGEFLYLIKKSSFVFTDSFHATIFSWIFQKHFFVFERFKKDDLENQNSRIYTLLEILGCQNNLFGSPNLSCISNFEEIKQNSIDFLKSHLS